jgi:hypothetical protein
MDCDGRACGRVFLGSNRWLFHAFAVRRLRSCSGGTSSSRHHETIPVDEYVRTGCVPVQPRSAGRLFYSDLSCCEYPYVAALLLFSATAALQPQAIYHLHHRSDAGKRITVSVDLKTLDRVGTAGRLKVGRLEMASCPRMLAGITGATRSDGNDSLQIGR